MRKDWKKFNSILGHRMTAHLLVGMPRRAVPTLKICVHLCVSVAKTLRLGTFARKIRSY
jgi:hypothetical protein